MRSRATILLVFVFILFSCSDGSKASVNTAFLSSAPVLLTVDETAFGFIRDGSEATLESSNETVASASFGDDSGSAYRSYRITAYAPGNCTITLTKNGELCGALEVDVSGNIQTSDVTEPHETNPETEAPDLYETAPDEIIDSPSELIAVLEAERKVEPVILPNADTQPVPETEKETQPVIITPPAEPVAVSDTIASTELPVETPVTDPADTGTITLVSLTDRVGRNNFAEIRVNVAPFSYCTITVTYSSGPSSAAGLDAKTADANGDVIWRWKVGGRTKPGSYPVTVSTNGTAADFYFEVIA